ncbi:HNH endonuclease [Chryseobacterium sp. CCH4-E10]|uniref:HNH endonuclease n=1 Tax=Chryseobacterium sp. CCH4-E10 TaxID=1768758 RepID=UPI0008306ECD|nr:HNH endonuclease [Chryseobacterium sp. CCH4-E10]
MNWVKENRNQLSINNYVRKADAKTNYWLDLSEGRINHYRNLTSDNFNIIIYGDEDIETDFYIIPFKELKYLLLEDNFAKSEGRRRWIGNIINHHISLSNTGIKLNISHRYSNPIHFKAEPLMLSVEGTNDYAIENAKREIQIRIKQSSFRKKVLKNFDHKCCLTGVTENDLLVASHIIPWSTKIDTRLSPHNGLCLSTLYDSLFDKGYFTLNEKYEVIIASKLDGLSLQTQNWLNEISGKVISNPVQYEISQIALEYHRNTIFDKF